MSWQTLGAVAPDGLVDARLQLHHAAQGVASAGVTFLEPEPDDSHPNLGWVDSCSALVGRSLPGANVQVATKKLVKELMAKVNEATTPRARRSVSRPPKRSAKKPVSSLPTRLPRAA